MLHLALCQIHERNELIRARRPLTKKEEEEEHDEYCKAVSADHSLAATEPCPARPVWYPRTLGQKLASACERTGYVWVFLNALSNGKPGAVPTE